MKALSSRGMNAAAGPSRAPPHAFTKTLGRWLSGDPSACVQAVTIGPWTRSELIKRRACM